MKRAPHGSSIAERLAFHSMPGPNGCVLWTGPLLDNGYPKMTVDGKTVSGHRVAWIEANGPIPDGLHVCHSCDVPICIKAEHLFLGTHIDNMADMRAKDRGPRGERCARAKLTADQVLCIRADIRSCRAIARDFGMGKSAIIAIKAGSDGSTFSLLRSNPNLVATYLLPKGNT